MFKGRFWVWVMVVACCLLIKQMFVWVPSWFESSDLTFTSNISTDSNMGEMLKGYELSGFDMKQIDSGADIILTDKSESIEGYKKYDNLLSSPLVLFVKNDVSSYPDGFIKVPTSSSAFRVDLYTILTAIENGKNWEDIGVHKNVVSGPVTLYIPNEINSYYSKVVDLFYITFNNGEMPSEERRAELEKKVNNILSKCHKIPDITQGVYEEKENDTKEGKVFIGPEFLYQRGSNYSMGTSYTDSYRPVHFMKTIFLYSDVFVKEIETLADVESDEVVDLGTEFIGKIKDKSDFMNRTGWRVKNSTYTFSDVFVNDPQ